MAIRILILAATAMFVSVFGSEPGFKPIEIPGVENGFAATTNIFSGGSPAGDQGFESLQKLGVKTIITVDGARPDLERAKKFGMRYIHIPHGYDGISSNVQNQLVKAAAVSEGPIFVHCHHGKHRGPAAVAVMCMANQGWSATQAEHWLVAAGTATNYQGLYKTVHEFQPPSEKALANISTNFPEAVKISGLVDAMVAIDDTFDRLKAIRKAGFKAPASHPDLVPANEALILKEHYRELHRSPDARIRGEKFMEALKRAETEAGELESVLRGAEKERAEVILKTLESRCASCHKAYRDTAH